MIGNKNNVRWEAGDMSYIQTVILREVKSLYENQFTDKNLETLIPYNEILMEKTKLSSSSQN